MRTKIVDRKFLDDEHYLLYLEKPDGFEFKPGQFVGVTAEIDGEKVKRFYSIASLPEENFILFYIKRVPKGKMSNFLANVPLGSEVELDNPMGHFTLDKSKYNKVIFIANGTGIAPIRPLAYYAKKEGKEVTVIHQERYEKLLVFREDFLNWGIRYIPILSRERKENILHGHVQDYLDNFFETEADYYVCGSPKFVQELVKLLKEKGAKNVIIEAF